MSLPEPPTDVVLRVSRDDQDDVYALFPGLWAGSDFVTCYQHVGQHCGADYHRCIQASRPARPDEYADILTELTRIGYRVRVVHRQTARHRAAIDRQRASFHATTLEFNPHAQAPQILPG